MPFKHVGSQRLNILRSIASGNFGQVGAAARDGGAFTPRRCTWASCRIPSRTPPLTTLLVWPSSFSSTKTPHWRKTKPWYADERHFVSIHATPGCTQDAARQCHSAARRLLHALVRPTFSLRPPRMLAQTVVHCDGVRRGPEFAVVPAGQGEGERLPRRCWRDQVDPTQIQIPMEDVVRYASQVAAGMSYISSLGVIHRRAVPRRPPSLMCCQRPGRAQCHSHLRRQHENHRLWPQRGGFAIFCHASR